MYTTDSELAQTIRDWATVTANPNCDIEQIVLDALNSIEADEAAGNTPSFELGRRFTRSGNPEVFYA